MLWALPSVALTEAGVAQVRFGRNLGPADASSGFVEAVSEAGSPASSGEARQSAEGATAAALSPEPSALGRPFVRLVDSRGELLAIAEPTPSGALHPSVVLM